jgi:hypothetical protein
MILFTISRNPVEVEKGHFHGGYLLLNYQQRKEEG